MSAQKTTTPEKSSTALRILQVIPDLDAGGAERTTVDVAAAIQRSGGQAVVASSGGRFEAELASSGAILERLPVHSKNPLTLWRNIGRLQSIIAKHQINLVHARSRAPAWSAFYAAQKSGIPFITTYHGTYSANSSLKRRYNAIMTKGVKTIANSHFIADHIQAEHHLPTEQIVTIPRGTDFSNLSPDKITSQAAAALRKTWGLSQDEGPIVLLPGRLTRWKGQAVLIDAAAEILRLGRKDFVCVLAGDAQGRDDYADELKRQIAEHKLTKHVRIVGHVDDMTTAYGLADVIISASTRPEAFGRVAVEAQAMQKPVVVTDHGGARETVLNGKTGWRVAPGDPVAMAQAIDATLAMTPESRQKMGQTGRNHVLKAYSVNQMCAKTLAVYRDVLAHP